jgi:sec-independent protein translocase protein TatA
MYVPQNYQTANLESGPTLLVLFGLAVLMFGGKKLPELAKGLGEGIKNFKQALREDEHPPAAAAAAPATAEPKKQDPAS